VDLQNGARMKTDDDLIEQLQDDNDDYLHTIDMLRRDIAMLEEIAQCRDKELAYRDQFIGMYKRRLREAGLDDGGIGP